VAPVAGADPPQVLRFGAKPRYDGETQQAQASAREESLSTNYAAERLLYANNGFELEKYCLQCLEKGVELYFRLTHAMIEPDLLAVRKKEPSADFMRAFAKLIGLTIQRSETLNPRVKAGSVASDRQRLRQINRSTTEARYQLSLAMGLNPEVELDGYSMYSWGGSFPDEDRSVRARR